MLKFLCRCGNILFEGSLPLTTKIRIKCRKCKEFTFIEINEGKAEKVMSFEEREEFKRKFIKNSLT